MSIREINYEKDIKAIEDIWQRTSDKEQKWKNVDGEIKCPKNKIYVKISEDSIVGFIVIRREDVAVADKLNYIFEIFVFPRRKYFGSELLKEMQYERGFLTLHVKKSKDGVIKFYEENGFKIIGENEDGSKYCMEWRKKNYK